MCAYTNVPLLPIYHRCLIVYLFRFSVQNRIISSHGVPKKCNHHIMNWQSNNINEWNNKWTRIGNAGEHKTKNYIVITNSNTNVFNSINQIWFVLYLSVIVLNNQNQMFNESVHKITHSFMYYGLCIYIYNNYMFCIYFSFVRNNGSRSLFFLLLFRPPKMVAK